MDAAEGCLVCGSAWLEAGVAERGLLAGDCGAGHFVRREGGGYVCGVVGCGQNIDGSWDTQLN